LLPFQSSGRIGLQDLRHETLLPDNRLWNPFSFIQLIGTQESFKGTAEVVIKVGNRAYVNQLYVTMTKYLRKINLEEEIFIWLTVSEVSVQGWLALLFLGLW
jgi:hypothetical protein